MPRVLLQPRGTQQIRGPENYAKSVARGLRPGEYREHLNVAEQAAFDQLQEGGVVRLWGATPTASTSSLKAMSLQERAPGDVVLFYGEGRFIARAEIAYLTDNAPLARAVWGTTDTGETWEHVLVLRAVEPLDIPSQRLLDPIGAHWVVQGPRLLSPAHSATVLSILDGEEPAGTATQTPATVTTTALPTNEVSLDEALQLARDLIGVPLVTVNGHLNRIVGVSAEELEVATSKSESGQPVPLRELRAALTLLRKSGSVRISPDELGYRSSFLGAVLATLPGAVLSKSPARVRLAPELDSSQGQEPYFAVLDGTALVRVRKEQALLRRLLCGTRDTAPCALCGREFQTRFLVAAHIKRRAVCTDPEKQDLANVAMLACNFGCDQLFEDGYLSVNEDGLIVGAIWPLAGSEPARQHLEQVLGRRCAAFSADSADYFLWHLDNVFLGQEAHS